MTNSEYAKTRREDRQFHLEMEERFHPLNRREKKRIEVYFILWIAGMVLGLLSIIHYVGKLNFNVKAGTYHEASK